MQSLQASLRRASVQLGRSTAVAGRAQLGRANPAGADCRKAQKSAALAHNEPIALTYAPSHLR